MDHMPADVFYEVVMPTLVTGAVFIGITTLYADAELSLVNKLISVNDEFGVPIIRSLQLKMVCEDCEAAGIAESCSHRMGELPYWQDERRHARIQQLYGSSNQATFMLEMRGVQSDGGAKPAFDPPSVARLRQSDTTFWASTEFSANHVFVTIDPHGGGDSSQYAIASFVYLSGDMTTPSKQVLVGAEAAGYRRPEDCVRLLIEHIRALRMMPGLTGASVVLTVEANYGNEARWIRQELKRAGFADIIFMKERMYHGVREVGVMTTEALKGDMAGGLDLRLRDGSFFIHEDFVTSADKSSASDLRQLVQNRTDMRERLVEQLENYCRITIPSKHRYNAPSIKYSGKSGRGFDDLAIAIQLNAPMHYRFCHDSDTYGKHR